MTAKLVAEPPDVVVVTTGIGFRGWMEAADAAGLAHDLHAVLEQARIIARGPKARGAIQAAGLQADWVAESETSQEICDVLLSEGVTGLKIAVQHHGSGADGIDDELVRAGAQVRSARGLPLGTDPPSRGGRGGGPARRGGAMRRRRLHVRTRRGRLAGGSRPARAEPRSSSRPVPRTHGVLAAAVGPVTAQPLLDAGITPVVPDRARLGALVRVLGCALDERQGPAVETATGVLRVQRTAAVLDGEVLALSPSSLAVLRAAGRGTAGRSCHDSICSAPSRVARPTRMPPRSPSAGCVTRSEHAVTSSAPSSSAATR